MNAIEWINAAIVLIGLPSMVAGLIFIGKKLQLLENLTATTEKIKKNVKIIGDHLTRVDTEFDHTELQAYSPLRLTPEGEKLIKDTGFDAVFKEHQDDFYTVIDSEEPKLKYDVEAAAIKSISVLADQDYMQFLKIFFYNNPARNMQNVAPTLGVYIRDKYLKEHPQIIE